MTEQQPTTETSRLDTGTYDHEGRYFWNLSPAEYAETIEKIAKINARAEKKGFTGRLVVEATKVERTRKVNGFKVTEPRYEVALTGTAPSYGGWTFLATLDFDPNAGLVTRNAPGVEINVERDGIEPGRCDHCGLDRNRRTTHVVVNDETGEQMVVGSTCIKDFLGWSATPVFLYTEDAAGEIDSLGFGGSFGGPADIATLDLLAIAWAAIRTYGYVPSSQRDFAQTTRDAVETFLYGKGKAAEALRAEIGDKVEGSAAAAVRTRDYILSDEFKGNSDYVINLKAILAAEYVSPRNVGYAVSAPQALARHDEQTLIREREAAKPSEWVGAIKDKITVTVTLKSVRYIESQWGTTVLYTLVEDSGNTFKWFASREALGDTTAVGKTFTLTGTVKDHEEWEGRKSTTLTRCKAV